jgi:hypothetical protein
MFAIAFIFCFISGLVIGFAISALHLGAAMTFVAIVAACCFALYIGNILA